MHAFFKFSRFKTLVFSHWTEYKKRYTLFTLALLGVMFFGAICLLLVDGSDFTKVESQYILFHFCWITAACIYSGTFLSNINDKSKGITYLMLPASTFEKLLCTFLFTVPLFFIVYVLIFYIIDFPFVAISNYIKYQEYILNKSTISHSLNYSYSNNYKYTPDKVISLFYDVKHEIKSYNNMTMYEAFLQMFFIGFGIQSFFLMGSAYFKKFAFVKTILAAFIIMLFFSVYTFMLVKHNNGPERILENYFSKKPTIDMYYWFAASFVWYFKLGLGLIFYLITFFHMKEKEI